MAAYIQDFNKAAYYPNFGRAKRINLAQPEINFLKRL